MLAELDITDCVIAIGVAKVLTAMPGASAFFPPGHDHGFTLPPRDPVLYFVQRMRDEAHRFAIGTHRADARKNL